MFRNALVIAAVLGLVGASQGPSEAAGPLVRGIGNRVVINQAVGVGGAAVAGRGAVAGGFSGLGVQNFNRGVPFRTAGASRGFYGYGVGFPFRGTAVYGLGYGLSRAYGGLYGGYGLASSYYGGEVPYGVGYSYVPPAYVAAPSAYPAAAPCPYQGIAPPAAAASTVTITIQVQGNPPQFVQ